jgi:eukaryotic-like serine/threonine-protein kinase
MALIPGTRLGPYEVVDLLGAGGMGEVYRARDTRLDRIVAIKVLSSGLASDPQLRERFEREARAISSLAHPNICVLHDVGREQPLPAGDTAATPTADNPSVDFLVMEYLDGETLATRLARGAGRSTRSLSHAQTAPSSNEAPRGSPATSDRAMSVREALRIAIPIARALDRAHRQGIVHRDLKPGNVMLTKAEGSEPGVKLLDFGLARFTKSATTRGGGAAAESDGLGRGLVSLADLATPTMSSPLTVKGTIIGTLQYMAPEQIEGKEIDARTDIFAFGAVLYEMLTGRRAFDGKSQASLIGAILDHDPAAVTSLHPATPPLLDEIVRRLLAKDPDDRWQSARDVMRQLEWVASQGTDALITRAEQVAHAPSSVRSRVLSLGAALVAGALLAAAVASWLLWPKPAAPSIVTRSTFVLPEDQRFSRGGRHIVALSPDGTRLVYVANLGLYLRPMIELSGLPIPGTEKSDPAEPVFSPDGGWVAFWSNDQLRKVPVTGGTPVTLCAAQTPLGMTWVGDRILFGQHDPQGHRGIVEVSANGGTPKLLIPVDAAKDESAHGPQVVADGRAVVFALRAGNTLWNAATIVAHELATGKRTVLVEQGTDPHVLPTGHLLFARGAALFAVPFDPTRLTVTGGPVPVQEGVRPAAGNASGAVHVAWSASGSLAFIPGAATTIDRTLVWADRNGKTERSSAPLRNYSSRATDMRVSPDGTRVAVVINATTPGAMSGATRAGQPIIGDDIWVWDIARTTLTRLTFTGQAGFPVWTPDSRRVCYASDVSVYCHAADGSGQAQVMVKVDAPDFEVDPTSAAVAVRAFSPEGTRMLFGARLANTKSLDIMMTTLGSSPETRALIHTPYNEAGSAVSPDGRWLAYHSNESGRNEVYVRPFPEVDQGRWQISTDGGAEPRWAANGRELFFTTGGGPTPLVVWGASIRPGSTFVASQPAVITQFPMAVATYDVAPDGRFLFNVIAANQLNSEPNHQLVIVQNWFDDLRRRVPIPHQ